MQLAAMVTLLPEVVQVVAFAGMACVTIETTSKSVSMACIFRCARPVLFHAERAALRMRRPWVGRLRKFPRISISTGSNERQRIRIVRVGRHARSDGGFDEQAEESVLGGAGDRPDGLRRGGEATDGVRSSGAGTVPGCRGDGSSAHGSGGGAS